MNSEKYETRTNWYSSTEDITEGRYFLGYEWEKKVGIRTKEMIVHERRLILGNDSNPKYGEWEAYNTETVIKEYREIQKED